MTSTDNKLKLIKIYFYVCHRLDIELKHLCKRFSKNNQPEFTVQGVITIYLCVMRFSNRFHVKDIHVFAKCHITNQIAIQLAY